MLFVHGWALDLDMWQAQINHLAPWYRVIAFDRRGFGYSSGLPSIEQDVADIEQLLDRFDISQAAIVGMSQGARVALRWAMRHRERISCLVLDGPPADGLSPQVREIPVDEYRELIRREGIEAFRRTWSKHPFMRLRTKALGARLLLQEMAVRYPARDLLMDELPPLAPLTMDDLLGLNVATLVLNGECDTNQRRAIGKQLVDVLRNAQLKIIPGAGHLAALDDHASYGRALHRFFDSQPAMARSS